MACQLVPKVKKIPGHANSSRWKLLEMQVQNGVGEYAIEALVIG